LTGGSVDNRRPHLGPNVGPKMNVNTFLINDDDRRGKILLVSTI